MKSIRTGSIRVAWLAIAMMAFAASDGSATTDNTMRDTGVALTAATDFTIGVPPATDELGAAQTHDGNFTSSGEPRGAMAPDRYDPGRIMPQVEHNDYRLNTATQATFYDFDERGGIMAEQRAGPYVGNMRGSTRAHQDNLYFVYDEPGGLEVRHPTDTVDNDAATTANMRVTPHRQHDAG